MRVPTNPRYEYQYRRQFMQLLGAGTLGLALTGCRPLTETDFS